MNKFILTAAAMTLAGTALAEPIQSLRGVETVDADSVAPEYKAYVKDRPPIARDYLQQPPLIPHQIEGYTINIRHNKCLSCHSWANYRSSRATKISQTHFESRDGAILANVSARRYFCTQCHVPQVDSAPLVENEFAPVEALKMN
jgi:cytochrome c-type protein NapB